MRSTIIILALFCFIWTTLPSAEAHPSTIGKTCSNCHKPHGAVKKPLLK